MDIHKTTRDTPIPRRSSSAASSCSRGSTSPGDYEYASSQGDYPEPFVLSEANTPSHEAARSEAVASPLLHPDEPRVKTTIPRATGADPIAIGMPILPRKPYTAAGATPPAPLSARGDVPGGYFPLHEDPTRRIRRTHPFSELESAQNARSPKVKARGEAPRATAADRLDLGSSPTKATPPKPPDTVVTSYVPSGLQTGSLPMGKYYPSNYETRSHPKTPPKPAKPAARVSSHAGTGPQKPCPDGDARQKLQQYQRDMVAQATLAASKLMRGHEAGSAGAAGLPAHGLPVVTPPAANPRSPRLRPLGSPGPVTPMELEGSDGSYLDKGRGAAAGGLVRDRERRQPMSPGNRMRAETHSPVATPAF